MEEKIVKLEEKLEILTKAVEKLTIPVSEENLNQPDQAVLDGTSSSPAHKDTVTTGSNNGASPNQATAYTLKDVQGEFAAVKDAYQSVKLPSDLRLNESRTGIRRQDQGEFNLIAKSARYIETVFKVLSQADCARSESESGTQAGHISSLVLDQIFAINLAHLRYIQEQYSNFVVQGTFDPTTSKLFRQLQRQSSGLSGEAIDTLHKAAGLAAAANRAAAVSRPHQQQYSRGRWGGMPRGRGRGRPDFFNRYSQRQPFPQHRREERGGEDE